MVWALKVADQQATLTVVPVLTESLTVECTVKFNNFDNSYNCVYSNSQSNPFADDCFAMGVRSDGKPFVHMGGVGSRYIAGETPLVTGTVYKLTAVFTSLNQTPPGGGGGTMELFVDDVSVGSIQPNSTPMHNVSDSITYIGAPSSSRSFDGNYYSGRITGDTYDYRWSADASSHGAGTPTLVSTVDANNFVGNNLPTDGSAWVEEGGDVTAPTWIGDPAITATSSIGHTCSQSINEDGTVYGVMLTTGATAPNAAQVKAGTDGLGGAAIQALSVDALPSTSCNLVFNLGTPGATYDYYFIAEDDALNLQANGEVKSLLAKVTNGVTLTITGDVLRPGQAFAGTYAGIADLASPVVMEDSQGNTLNVAITDQGSGNFIGTMPSLPISGSSNLLLFGSVTVTGVPT